MILFQRNFSPVYRSHFSFHMPSLHSHMGLSRRPSRAMLFSVCTIATSIFSVDKSTSDKYTVFALLAIIFSGSVRLHRVEKCRRFISHFSPSDRLVNRIKFSRCARLTAAASEWIMLLRIERATRARYANKIVLCTLYVKCT